MANSNLIANLNSIYATKLEIKEVLNTESDDFTEYPDLIEAAIASGGASGYAYITENGDHDIATYAYVNVNVPQQEVPVVPPGYSYVYGTKEILENGTVDISSYASAYVNVPAPEGWILPSGYAFITSNGNFDIREFESVNVDVPQGGAVVLGNLTVSENGQYSASSYSYDGFDTVSVNVPAVTPVLNSLSVSANGVYTPQTGVDGFNEVTVNVPTGGSSIHDGLTPYTAFTVDELISYMNENYNPGDPQTANALYVKGKIANVIYTFSAQYPSWRGYLTNDGTFYYETENPSNYDLSKDLYVYGCFWESTQSQLWDSSVTPQVAVGDEVIILAPVAINNNGRVGTQNGYLYSHQKPVTGQLTISQSGTYDVQNYVSAYVDVQGGGGYPETTYSLTGYVLDSTRLLVNNNAVNISNGDYLGLSYSYNLGQEITLPNCVQVYADRFIESMGGNVSNVFWFDNNNTITYTGNTRAFTYTGNITLNGYGPIDTQEKNYWYDQYPQKEIRLYDNDGNDYYITDGDYRKYIYNISSIRGLTANISYITDNYSRKFATINSISPVQYTGFMYESIYRDPSTDVNFTSETIDGHTGLSCSLALKDPTLTGGELVGGGVVKATLNGSDYFDIQLDGLNIDDGTTLSYEQRYFGKFGTSANLNVGWYDDVHTCESMKLFIYLDDSTWVAKYIWTLN